MKRTAANSETPTTTVAELGPSRSAGTSVLVVGPGGNIGSSLMTHIARIQGLRKVTLIDPDRYESRNLSGQNIDPADVGRLKARAMASRLRRVNPDLPVEAIVARVEDVPLGRLRVDVMVSCLDSRAARCYVNQAVRWLGIRWWVDAGVAPEGLLVRVTVLGAPDSACYECGWGEADYAGLEQVRPCLGDATTAPPTNSPSALGALAASHQALELQKVLAGDGESLAGKQITISAASHRLQLTSLRLDPGCRCDHQAWEIQTHAVSPGQLSVGAALELGPAGDRGGPSSLSVAGKSFVREMQCTSCGWQRSLTRLEGRLTRTHRTCAKCGGPMAAVGFKQLERLSADVLTPAALARPLAGFGLQPGDILTIERDGHETHHEIGGSP